MPLVKQSPYDEECSADEDEGESEREIMAEIMFLIMTDVEFESHIPSELHQALMKGCISL